MESEEEKQSCARAIAMRALLAVDLDPNDFRLRDKVLVAISPMLESYLDSVADDSIYRRAMESMARQFVCPKMTAEELAMAQIKDHSDA